MSALIIKHTKFAKPGALEDFLDGKNIPYKTTNLAMGENLPSKPNMHSAIISLGGPMNVDEENNYPFLKAEKIFLKKAIKKEIPILGICLGAQLLAAVTKAKITKAPIKEVGWYKVSLTDHGLNDPLFQGIEKEIDAFQWQNNTFHIPETGIRLAGSDSSPNQVFRYGKNAYGVKFHPEITLKMIEEWLKEYSKGIDFLCESIDLNKINEESYNKIENHWKTGRVFFSNFFKISGLIEQ